jgi:23S rRNA pseudouridine1911/1915/1917 synthase
MNDPAGVQARELVVHARARLDEVLGLPRRLVQELCAAGRVRVLAPDQRLGRAVPEGRPWLSPGTRVVVLDPGTDPRFLGEEIPLEILHADEHLLLVIKPAELTTMPGPGHPAGTLVHALRGLGCPLSSIEGPLRPGIVHRLDLGTSGVLAVACSDEAHRGLAAQFRSHRIERRYLALVRGQPGWEETEAETWLARRRPGRRSFAAVAEGQGKWSRTRFRVLAQGPDTAVVEAKPLTGRTHQIRVQLATLGHPLVGDIRYGGAAARHHAHQLGLRRHALHAAELVLRHPATGAQIGARAPLPPDLRATGLFPPEIL